MKAVKIKLGKVSITVHGIWEDIDYDKLSLVYHKANNASYISRKPVPKGTDISNRNYWALIVQGSIPDNTLGEIYTRDEVDNILKATVDIIKQDIISNLKNYYTKEESDNILKTLDNKLINNFNTKLEEYYNKIEIDVKLVELSDNINNKIDSDLENYYNKSEIDSNLENYATKEEIENNINSEQLNSILINYAKKSDLELYATVQLLEGYLKKTDAADFATKTELNLYAKLDALSSYVTIDSLKNYYTKTEIDDTYAKISDIPEIPTFKTINGQSIIGTGDIVIESTAADVNYTPTLDESTQITTEIGSIKAGSTLGELAGKSYSEIIDAMLVNETYNDPRYIHNISLGSITTLVKVGSSVVVPSIIAVWNSNIQSSFNKVITNTLTKNILGTSETVYNTSGNSTFVLTYSYPEGYYDITSNLGNTKRIIVPGKTNATISKTITATYPWFINTTEQDLVAIGNSKTIEVELTGSPSIKVPFTNSTVTIQADLGFGWMDVNWNINTDNSNLGGAIDETVPYKVYSKPDTYASSVKHKITINLRK